MRNQTTAIGTFILMCMTALLSASSTVQAGMVVFGNTGWQVEWDSSLDDQVDVDFIDVIGNVIFIQKAAEFTDPANGGIHAPVTLTFRQTGPSTITNFVIDDEIIENLTGTTWTGFTMRVEGNSVAFNPQMTASSGGGGPIGFSIDPFTTAQFEDGNHSLVIGGGTVQNNEVWFPGGTANDGQLWIDAQSGEPGALSVFTLVEQPGSSPGPNPPPVCIEITPPGDLPDCGSAGNSLSAVTENVTPGTTQDWEVVSGPCVIQTVTNSSITYSISDSCPQESCCMFRFTVDDPADDQAASVCEHQVCCECPVVEELACRVTGGGNDKSRDFALNPNGELNRFTWGGQVGAPTAAQPQPFGEWTHRQHSGPAGKWTFHAGTHSAPDETEIDLVTCCDPGYCHPARPAPAHQIDFQGVGAFKNTGSSDKPPGVIVHGPNRTFHWFTVHVEDAGEPGSHDPPASGCPETGFNCAPIDCACPDFYHITIYKGVKRGESPNTVDKIYEVYGYINGGNLQLHPPIGDVNVDHRVGNADLRIVMKNMGTIKKGDINGNGVVDEADVSLLLSHWGDSW